MMPEYYNAEEYYPKRETREMNNIDPEINASLMSLKSHLSDEEIELPKKEINIRSVLSKAAFPERHIRATMAPNEELPSWQKAKELWSRFGSNDDFAIVLAGSRGVGKTAIAAFIATFRAQEGRTGISYTRTVDLFSTIKRSWDSKKESEEEILRRYATVPFLVIDEIQERGTSDWEPRILTNLFDHRYGAMLATIMITNLEPDNVPSNLGSSICSRISETGGTVDCNWKSIR